VREGAGIGWLLFDGMDLESVALRPIQQADFGLLDRFSVEPGLIGPNWYGFRDVGRARRRFETDGWLGAEDGRLMVTVQGEPVGFVGWSPTGHGTNRYRSIGITLLPEWRGRGVGSRAQRLLCAYLFTHTPIPRIEAGTQPENVAEQRALESVGFQREGTLRAADFRDGQWRDVVVYGLLRGELRG
jgi:RimJ/RimL family protein N-acetyltransferase